MIWFFLTSGLFLGWSLGANHGVNIFGTAVVSKMVRFKTAAIIAGIFVTLGAVISGEGASKTLNELGAVNTLAGSFTVALAVAITVTMMTKLKLPVSVSQAVVGGIIGWNIFTGSPTDTTSLTKILSTWVVGPVLSAGFALIIFIIIAAILRKIKLHILRLDALTRIGFLIIGAFASYSLGANNIANVMGMFVNSAPFSDIHIFQIFIFSSTKQLFLVGGIAIAIGIFTYSYKVMLTVGNELYKITPITGLIVVLSEAIVLFLFSSEQLEYWLISHKLPSIPLVPLSSTQLTIGAVIGVGLAKGGRGINYKILGKIVTGWAFAPITAALICFVTLFFVQNVFEQKVVNQIKYKISSEVLTTLSQHNIPIEPLLKLKDKDFTGSALFRQTLKKEHKWKENQIYLIFSFSELDSFFVDSTIAKNNLSNGKILHKRLEALKCLHGRAFSYKWQFENALETSSDAWKPKSGNDANIYNKRLKKEKSLVYDLFRKKSQHSDE